VLKPGLVSITFRQLPPHEVVKAAARAGLEGIEWGGDVHVVHGDLGAAEQAARMTREAGLTVSSYGSYYRLGEEEQAVDFRAVLDTALALEAPILRVWPGRRASADADDAYRARVAEDGRRAAGLASAAGVTLATEWHANSLTDSAESAVRLFRDVNHENFRTYWQARNNASVEACLADMEAALPRLVGVHVFQWAGPGNERRPLAECRAAWTAYLRRAAPAADQRFAMLEFTRDNAPAHMIEDAAVLRDILDEVNAGLSR